MQFKHRINQEYFVALLVAKNEYNVVQQNNTRPCSYVKTALKTNKTMVSDIE